MRGLCGGELFGGKEGAGTFRQGDDKVVDFGVGACLVDLGVGDGVGVDTEEEVFANGACVGLVGVEGVERRRWGRDDLGRGLVLAIRGRVFGGRL